VIENALRYDFKQWMRGGEVDEAGAFIPGHKIAATLDKQRSIIAEERT
jgi:hypothetical protein